MDDLESKISQILDDPGSMAQILSLAKSLGITPPQEGDAPQPDSSLAPVLSLLQQAGKADSREAALLGALKPYCSKERQEKIDRALRIAQLSQLAGVALRNYEKKE
ncbi:MAG: hypothetical protein VB055_07670 [Oscillospiraceae bacterium]|nr:hypothetical protein [Oscillospiraceae bacterium]